MKELLQQKRENHQKQLLSLNNPRDLDIELKARIAELDDVLSIDEEVNQITLE